MPVGSNLWIKSLKQFMRQTKLLNKEKARFIGQDHLGNQYFETDRPGHSFRPVQRFFQRSKSLNNFNDLIDAAHVPPAWDAWLRFRRDQPPTVEEVNEGEEYFNKQQAMAAQKKQQQEKDAKTPAIDDKAK